MGATTIHYGARHGQAGDLWRPEQAADDVPVVVLIHGGFWRSQFTKRLMSRMARAVVKRGWAAWNIEYRRVGPLGGGGGWPQTFADVADAVDHVAALPGVDTGRVVTCGHSAGGTLALWAAGRHRLPVGSPGSTVTVTVSGAISLAGVVDLAAADAGGVGGSAVADLLGGSEAQVPDRFATSSPAALVPLGVPQVLIHGRDDVTVPVSMSESYAAAATAAGDDARFVALDGVGHRQVIDPHGDPWDAITSHLDVWFAS